jgi:hypothetical protein
MPEFPEASSPESLARLQVQADRDIYAETMTATGINPEA